MCGCEPTAALAVRGCQKAECEPYRQSLEQLVRIHLMTTMLASSVLGNAAFFFMDRLFWGKVLGLLLALLGSASSGLAAPEFVTHTLSNGLTVVLVEEHWHPLVALDICYRAGSRYDPGGKQGLAHLVEHLTFRSPSFSGEEHEKPVAALEQAAATTNQDISCWRDWGECCVIAWDSSDRGAWP